jgi:hypothetical protein
MKWKRGMMCREGGWSISLAMSRSAGLVRPRLRVRLRLAADEQL